jgi:hypothetical protein
LIGGRDLLAGQWMKWRSLLRSKKLKREQ